MPLDEPARLAFSTTRSIHRVSGMKILQMILGPCTVTNKAHCPKNWPAMATGCRGTVFSITSSSLRRNLYFISHESDQSMVAQDSFVLALNHRSNRSGQILSQRIAVAQE